MSAEREGETGVFELPKFEQRRYDSLGRRFPSGPSDRMHWADSIRANLSAAATSKLDLSVSSTYQYRSAILAGVERDGGHRVAGVRWTWLSHERRGGRPRYAAQRLSRVDASLYVGRRVGQKLKPLYRKPQRQLAADLVARHADELRKRLTDRVDEHLLLRGSGPPLTATYRLGFKFNTRADIRNLSADLASSASWQARENVSRGQRLGPSTSTTSSSSAKHPARICLPVSRFRTMRRAGSRESATYSKTLGLLSKKRLHSTIACSSPRRSAPTRTAFGTEFQRVFYPKASVSWILSDEPFFPRSDG